MYKADGPGEENIDEDPMFDNTNFYLMSGSLCIDAGNPDVAQNDPEDILNPGMAEFPSMGNLRNDMGAHGGPFRKILVDYLTQTDEHKIINSTGVDFTIYPNPWPNSGNIRIINNHQGFVTLDLYTISGIRIKRLLNEMKIPGTYEMEIDLSDLPKGIYFCVLITDEGSQSKKLIKR